MYYAMLQKQLTMASEWSIEPVVQQFNRVVDGENFKC